MFRNLNAKLLQENDDLVTSDIFTYGSIVLTFFAPEKSREYLTLVRTRKSAKPWCPLQYNFIPLTTALIYYLFRPFVYFQLSNQILDLLVLHILFPYRHLRIQ